MKDNWKHIKIITRPTERLGHYEYYMDMRKKRFHLFKKQEEPNLFIAALQRISNGSHDGKDPLTKPSEKDKGLKIDPVESFKFYRIDKTYLFFPNENIYEIWLKENMRKYTLTKTNPTEFIHGIEVINLDGKFIGD